jgi:hypothetical protein
MMTSRGIVFGRLLRRGWRSRGSRLGLLYLQVVHHRLYACDSRGVAGRGNALRIAVDVTAQGNYTVRGLHANLVALDSGIAINSCLNIDCNLGVGPVFIS